MSRLLNKSLTSLKKDGLVKTAWRVAKHLHWLVKRSWFERKVLKHKNIEDRFTEIYKHNYWGSQESVSGAGSTLEYTANLRRKLPDLFERFSIRTVFDAPCGDFNWMRHVLKDTNPEYIGGDIVAPLIDTLKSKYANEKIRFLHLDLIRDAFPEADLMICRDCLFHFSFHDTKLVLGNFVDSKTRYFLTTTHIHSEPFQNRDIATGDYRSVDLFGAPYNLPRDVLYRIEDWKAPAPVGEMCLWTRDQIIGALKEYYSD